MIHYIDESIELLGKRVLLRLDLNVPVENNIVQDPYRMERVIETVDFLRLKGAQTIIISHCEGKESNTLLPMWDYLKGYFPVDFSPTFFTPESIAKLINLKNGGVLLFENVRINSGEKANDQEFAKQLAGMADIYVNDAFGVSHRSHASIVGVPKYLPHYGGILLRKEIENLSHAFSPERPFLFILGGAKFETKLPIIQKYLDRADYVFVGGALAHNFFQEMGYEIGCSLISQGEFGIKNIISNKKIILPKDVLVTDEHGVVSFKKPDNLSSGDCIGDVGPETIENLQQYVREAKTILWNGPMGNYEKGFVDKTEAIAEIVSQSHARTIVGGGDTLAAIKKLQIDDKFTFISTGGGAMLDFLVNETLPGIEALS